MATGDLGRADLWLAQESTEPEVLVVGVPWAASSPGVARAPLAVRDRLSRFSTYHSERDVDFSQIAANDAGNWPVSRLDRSALAKYVSGRMSDLTEVPLVLYIGGDEGITRVLASDTTGEMNRGLIRFSGRPSENLPGEGLPGQNIVLIGLHTLAATADEVARSKEAGVTAISNDQIDKEGTRMTFDRAWGKLSMSEVIHVSVHLDALDSIHAPGCVTAIPGGMTLRQLSDAVRRCGSTGKVRSMDFVGADADSDPNGVTLDSLTHLMLSAVAGFAERRATAL